MPLDSGHRWDRTKVVSATEILARIHAAFPLVATGRDDEIATSESFRFADGVPGRIGVIAPVTRPFCGACSRLRITADGKVRPCLFSTVEWDLRPLLRGDAADEDIARFLVDVTWTKQAGRISHSPTAPCPPLVVDARSARPLQPVSKHRPLPDRHILLQSVDELVHRGERRFAVARRDDEAKGNLAYCNPSTAVNNCDRHESVCFEHIRSNLPKHRLRHGFVGLIVKCLDVAAVFIGPDDAFKADDSPRPCIALTRLGRL
jgi:hypothetical protein